MSVWQRLTLWNLTLKPYMRKIIKDITRQASTILPTLLFVQIILISEIKQCLRPSTNDIENLNDATLLSFLVASYHPASGKQRQQQFLLIFRNIFLSCPRQDLNLGPTKQSD